MYNVHVHISQFGCKLETNMVNHLLNFVPVRVNIQNKWVNIDCDTCMFTTYMYSPVWCRLSSLDPNTVFIYLFIYLFI